MLVSMANTSARMLRLLSLLQTHRYWPGDELADQLGVSLRTLRRDIDRLRDLGYLVDANRGVAGGYQLRAGSALPPLLLDDDEAVAIAMGLRTTTAASITGVGDTAVRALTKIVQVMPPRLRRRVEALQASTVPALFGGPTIDVTALTTIAQACRDTERLRFAYTTRDGQRHPERLVEPHWLVSLGTRWYLVAWDLDRADWRSFRLDRLTEPVTTGARFRQRTLPEGDAADFVRAGISAARERRQVVVEVDVPAARVERVVGGWGSVEPNGEESCVLTMAVETFDWPVLVLGSLSADFRVVEPPELVDHLREVGARFVRSTGSARHGDD